MVISFLGEGIQENAKTIHEQHEQPCGEVVNSNVR